MPSKRIAIIGAGPIGLEAALYGARLGYDVRVYERGRIGDNMKSWGHVRLFSPWGMNRSSLGVRTLREAGIALPADDAYPTGREVAERYLLPLARSAHLEGRVEEETEVLSVGRDGLGKRDLLGEGRRKHPFRLLVQGPRGEEIVEADAVIDCSGTYGNSNWMGNGNIPAVGERHLSDRIAYTLEDIAGAARDRYEGRRILLVGSGHSAATALDALLRLPGTRVLWVARTRKAAPHPFIADDPLPERARLSARANRLASGAEPRVVYRPATEVERVVASVDGGFEVTLRSEGARETAYVDCIVAHVGYRPDNGIYSELQVHECYASMGPMKLSAALLGEDSADCLQQSAKGAEVLENPEPDFFIIGSKSYGKNSNFLIRIGIEQVREVYGLLTGDSKGSLYAS